MFCSVYYWTVLAISSRYIDVTGLHALPGSLTLLLLIVAKVKNKYNNYNHHHRHHHHHCKGKFIFWFKVVLSNNNTMKTFY